MSRDWQFLRTTTLRPMGRLTLTRGRVAAAHRTGARVSRAARGTHRRRGAAGGSRPRGADPAVPSSRARDSWELPGGGGQAGETPEAAAQRELREEGGYRAARLTFLTRFFPSSAYLDEEAHCFIGEELTADPLPADDDEFIERRVTPLREAVAMALDDRIRESVSKVALLCAALRLGLRI